MSPTFSFRVHDRIYTLNPKEVTGIDARLFRQAVGVSLLAALNGVGTGTVDALEFVAGFKWIVDRRDDESLTFESVLGSLTYEDIELDVEEVPEPEDFPTQGGDSAKPSPPSPTSTASDPGKSSGSPLASSIST